MLPAPDLLDRGPRIRRLVLSLIVALAAGTLAFILLYHRAEPDLDHHAPDGGHSTRAWNAIGYIAGAIATGTFVLTLKLLQWRAKKLAERPAAARVVRR